MNKTKILVTGSNGLLGQEIMKQARDHQEIEFIFTSKRTSDLPIVKDQKFEVLDVTNPAATNYLIDLYNPDAIIHAAAMSRADQCELEKEECTKVNYEGTRIIADECKNKDIFLLFLSSDFIFDGTRGNYREEDQANPQNQYGLSKKLSEQYIQEQLNAWSIVRTSLVYGIFSGEGRSNIVSWIRQFLMSEKPIRVVGDQVRTPTHVFDLARACQKITREKRNGIFHVSGPQFMTVYSFAVEVARTFNLDSSLIRRVETQQLNEAAKRPLITGLDIQKARIELDYRPMDVIKGLKRVREELGPMTPE